MSRLIRIFSLATLSILCLFTVSCEDDDGGCASYFLTEVANEVYVDKLYYNDDGLLAVVLQSVEGNAPRRDEYSYNANRQLVRVDVHGFFYNTFSYDDDGRIELIRTFSTETDETSGEIKYIYGSDGKLARREQHRPELIYYELYEYPADNIIKVLSYRVGDDGSEEENPIITYTLDNNPVSFPKEWYLEYAVWGGVITSNNIVSYETVDDGVVDPTRSFTVEFKYNEGGYPVSRSIGGAVFETFTYSCDPVKEQ
jgi:hypothetical protein